MPRRSLYGLLLLAFPVHASAPNTPTRKNLSSLQSLEHCCVGKLEHKHRKWDADLLHLTLELNCNIPFLQICNTKWKAKEKNLDA